MKSRSPRINGSFEERGISEENEMAAGNNTQFAEFLEAETKKSRGSLVPVKASVVERMLIKKAACGKLHPNPEDEFCDPSIGPNYEIISGYVDMIVREHTLQPHSWDEPLMVEKVHPSGYMILNGHHRWAAAIRAGMKRVPVAIVNLTQETDIEKMLQTSKHDKRVTLDLDEVVFCSDRDKLAEKPLPFPFSRMYKERIRQGIPALLHFLSKRGYDIWVYTAQYYSYDYIRAYFKRYSVKVDGIITGTARKTKADPEEIKRAESLFAARYAETIHIDNDMLLRTRRDTKEFEEYGLDCDPADWSHTVISVIEGLKDHGAQ